MKQIGAIAWKEWRENSPLLWIALGVFLGLPIIGGLEYMLSSFSHHFEITTEPGVLGLGGVFAIFVAVGATCRDLNGKLEDFWRSRPVTGMQWMLLKFVVGLGIVLISLLIPLLAALMIDRTPLDLRQMIWTLPATWCLFYCIGFLAGCLLQRPAHAAVLALAALLLIYFVPMLLLPGNEYQISQLLEGSSAPAETIEWVFGIAAVLFLLAIIAAQLQWRIEPGPKFMYGTIAAAFLIFLFSTGYRLGTNLPVLQQIDLEPNEYAETLYMNGSHGYLETYHEAIGGRPRYFRELELTSNGLKVGPRQDANQDYWLNLAHSAASLRRGDVEYMASFFDDSLTMSLQVVDFEHDPMGILTLKIPLPIHAVSVEKEPWPILHIWNDRLYLIGEKLVTVDISKPLSPKVVSSVPLGYSEGGGGIRYAVARWSDNRTLEFTLPQVPGLPNGERLQVAIRAGNWSSTTVFNGKIFCWAQGNDVTECCLEQLTPKKAIFKRIGESDDLETLLSWGWGEDLRLHGDLLYVSERRDDLNPVIKVYATTGPARPRLMGHFAAQSSEMYVEPMADGRAIIAGSKIWLVGPPPHVKN